MNRLKYISIVVLGIVLLLFSEDAFAQRYYNQSYRPNSSRTKIREGFNRKGMSFGVGALYYFGDADSGKGSLPVITGITLDDLSAAAFYNYNWPLTDHIGVQAGVDVGVLRGNNHKNTEVPRREFMSVFVQPNVGINIFPADELGLVVHMGIAATASYLLKADYAAKSHLPKPTFGILPMGQVSIGYNWNLYNNWRIGIFGAFKMGFCDMKDINLDGWPVEATPTANDWPDGYFEIGISVNYFQKASLPFFK